MHGPYEYAKNKIKWLAYTLEMGIEPNEPNYRTLSF